MDNGPVLSEIFHLSRLKINIFTQKYRRAQNKGVIVFIIVDFENIQKYAYVSLLVDGHPILGG